MHAVLVAAVSTPILVGLLWFVLPVMIVLRDVALVMKLSKEMFLESNSKLLLILSKDCLKEIPIIIIIILILILTLKVELTHNKVVLIPNKVDILNKEAKINITNFNEN